MNPEGSRECFSRATGANTDDRGTSIVRQPAATSWPGTNANTDGSARTVGQPAGSSLQGANNAGMPPVTNSLQGTGANTNDGARTVGQAGTSSLPGTSSNVNPNTTTRRWAGKRSGSGVLWGPVNRGRPEPTHRGGNWSCWSK